MKKIIAAAVLAGILLTMPVLAGQLMGGWQATTDTAIDEDAQAAFDAAME